MDNNDIRRVDPILPYSRRYVVVGEEERDILDTKYVNINDYYTLSDEQKTYLAEKLVLTRYPSRLAAREAELSLNNIKVFAWEEPNGYPIEEDNTCRFCNDEGIPPDDDDGDQQSPNGEDCPVCGKPWNGRVEED